MVMKQKELEEKKKIESCSRKSESSIVYGRFSEGIHRWQGENEG